MILKIKESVPALLRLKVIKESKIVFFSLSARIAKNIGLLSSLVSVVFVLLGFILKQIKTNFMRCKT